MIHIVLLYTLIVAAQGLPSSDSGDRRRTVHYKSLPTFYEKVGLVHSKRTKQFYIYSEKVEWDKASSLCEKYGRHLASVENYVQEQRIEKLLLRGNVLLSIMGNLPEAWLSTTYRDMEDKSEGLGTPLTFTKLDNSQQKNKESQNCLSVRLNPRTGRFEWNETFCGLLKSFICES